MKIISFGCTRYKAFKDPVSIELRPLTLFFGKNNSGKSALLRLPRLLLRALSARNYRGFPLVVDGLNYGRYFHELIHGGDLHGSAEFSIVMENSGESLELTAEVQNIYNASRVPGKPIKFPVVSNFRLTGSSISIDWTWEPEISEVANYQGIGKIPFWGLFPNPKSGKPGYQLRSHIDTWRKRVTNFEDRMEHLGPMRANIERVYVGGQTGPMDFNGEGSINQIAHNDDLLTELGEWYEKHLEGWRFDLKRSGDAVEPVLKRGQSTVSLADCGQGMQHLLPIVIQQLGHQLDEQEPFLNLVEEPELHLHAAAHAPLGDLFLNTAKTGRGQVIVETHSENLLLRIRRRIAEGQDPNLVALYWIEDLPEGFSNVRRINILKNGEVDWWPEGIFSEGYQEVRHLRRAGRPSSGGLS